MDTPDRNLDWLLESDDPALRYQTLRDLTTTPVSELEQVRSRIPGRGLAYQILAHQGEDGAWHRPGAPDWLPTLFMFQLLRAAAADPADPAIESSVARLAAGFRWHHSLGGKPFFDGETEPCINGGALAASSYFGRLSHTLAQRLLAEQLPDGGWNCEAPKSQRSSFHSTICVLEGLLEYERATESDSQLAVASASARRRAEHYLMERALFRRLSTGAVANPEFLQSPGPRATTTTSSAPSTTSAPPVSPPIRACARPSISLESKRQPDGRWLPMPLTTVPVLPLARTRQQAQPLDHAPRPPRPPLVSPAAARPITRINADAASISNAPSGC